MQDWDFREKCGKKERLGSDYTVPPFPIKKHALAIQANSPCEQVFLVGEGTVKVELDRKLRASISLDEACRSHGIVGALSQMLFERLIIDADCDLRMWQAIGAYGGVSKSVREYEWTESIVSGGARL